MHLVFCQFALIECVSHWLLFLPRSFAGGIFNRSYLLADNNLNQAQINPSDSINNINNNNNVLAINYNLSKPGECVRGHFIAYYIYIAAFQIPICDCNIYLRIILIV